MNVIARLEFELAYYDITVQRFNHYTTRTPPNINEKIFKRANCWLQLFIVTVLYRYTISYKQLSLPLSFVFFFLFFSSFVFFIAKFLLFSWVIVIDFRYARMDSVVTDSKFSGRRVKNTLLVLALGYFFVLPLSVQSLRPWKQEETDNRHHVVRFFVVLPIGIFSYL